MNQNTNTNSPLFDWEDFLKLCECIQTNNYFSSSCSQLSDAIYRTVISRSYYSAFRRVGLHLKNRKLFTTDKNLENYQEFGENKQNKFNELNEGGSHKIILDRLDKSANLLKENRYNKISETLEKMKKNRKKADYCIRSAGIDKELANNSIKKAKEIIELLNSIENPKSN